MRLLNKMKMIVVLLFILLTCFIFTGCNEEEEKECIITMDDITILLGENYTLNPTCNLTKVSFTYTTNDDIITLNDNVIEPVNVGVASITIQAQGYEVSKTIKVTVCNEGITITGSKSVVIEEETELNLIFYGVDEDSKVTWKSSDTAIARVSKGIVTGIDFGKVTITAKCEDYTSTFEIEVIRPAIKEITASDALTLEEKALYEITFDVSPFYSSREIKIEASNDCVSIDPDNSVRTLKQGETTLTLISLTDETVKKTINVSIIANEKPKFEEQSDYVDKLEVKYGEEYNLLEGLKVIDNADGDITDQVEYDESLLYAYGENQITLTVRDKAGNETTLNRTVVVTWPYHTKFIGHSGCYYGVPNTEEAFLYAASVLHYQAIECDVHLTKDGVFVTNHNSYLTTTDEQGNEIKVVITETNYEDLVKYTLTSGKYTGHVCTLERYLEICKKYGCEAIIELKSTTGISEVSQASMPKICELIKKKGMWEQSKFLTYNKSVIQWLRSNKYDIGIQYLTQGGDSDDILNYCVKYNCDLSVNVTYGQSVSDEYIKKYHDAGVIISTWTFSGKYSQVQEWIDKGVEYVTCDIHYMDQLELK